MENAHANTTSATPAKTVDHYEVLTWSICDGWHNCWSLDDKPHTFATYEEADREREEYIEDCNEGPWFLNFYRCDRCGEAWSDEWDCQCDDDCPTCGQTCSPAMSEDVEKESGEDLRIAAVYTDGTIEHVG